MGPIKVKALIPISMIALAVMAGIIGYSVLQNFSNSHTANGYAICPRMIPNYILWFSMILMVVIILPISYYVISKRLEEKMEKNLNAITRMVNHDVKSDIKNGDLKTNNNSNILKLLNINEKKVIDKIIENKGAALQSEISRMEGMTKLKTHRAVKELESKGIVKLEHHGKTNRIILRDDIRELLLK